MDKNQGHGDHIDAIIDPEKYIVDYLLHDIEKSIPDECSEIETDYEGSIKTRKVIGLKSTEGDMAMESILLNCGDNLHYASSYPVLKGGEPCKVTIVKVEEWAARFEASVEAEYDGKTIHFFPTDFYYNKDRYTEGAELDMEFAALGYVAEELKETTFKLEGEAAERHCKILGDEPEFEEDGSIKPIVFDMSNLVAYLPKEDYPEDAEFQSPLRNIQELKFMDLDFVQADILVHRDEDMPAKLYFRKDKLNEDTILREEMPVRGIYWLQGKIHK